MNHGHQHQQSIQPSNHIFSPRQSNLYVQYADQEMAKQDCLHELKHLLKDRSSGVARDTTQGRSKTSRSGSQDDKMIRI